MSCIGVGALACSKSNKLDADEHDDDEDEEDDEEEQELQEEDADEKEDVEDDDVGEWAGTKLGAVGGTSPNFCKEEDRRRGDPERVEEGASGWLVLLLLLRSFSVVGINRGELLLRFPKRRVVVGCLLVGLAVSLDRGSSGVGRCR